MEMSCKVKYALAALIELASHHEQGEPLQISQIAANQQIPDRYLEQLLTILRRGKLVRSQRGAKGGYVLARKPWQITLLEVMTCLEGTHNQKPDGKTASTQTPESSELEEIWQEGTAAAIAVWQRYTIQDLCEKRDEHQRLNTMYYI